VQLFGAEITLIARGVTPSFAMRVGSNRGVTAGKCMVGTTGLEPATSVISDNQISRSTTYKNPDATTMKPKRFQTVGTDRFGHRQASTEVVCFGEVGAKSRVTSGEVGNGPEDGAEVSGPEACAK